MKNCTFSDRWQYIIETGVNVAETEDSVSSFMQYKKQEIEIPNTELQKGREAPPDSTVKYRVSYMFKQKIP